MINAARRRLRVLQTVEQNNALLMEVSLNAKSA